MSEILSIEIVENEPQKAADRMKEILKDKNLTKSERTELLKVIDKINLSKNKIIQNSLKELNKFVKENGYIGFKSEMEKAISENTGEGREDNIIFIESGSGKLEDLDSLPQNKRFRDLKAKYSNDPNSLTEKEKLDLADHLINSHMLDDHITAANINTKKYFEIVKKEILFFITIPGLNISVISNLKKIGLSDEEIKKSVLTETKKITGLNSFGLSTDIERYIPTLVRLGLKEELDRLEKLLPEDYQKNDFKRKTGMWEIYGDYITGYGSGYSTSGINVELFRIVRNGEEIDVVYIDKDNYKEIPKEKRKYSDPEDFLEEYRSKKVEKIKRSYSAKEIIKMNKNEMIPFEKSILLQVLLEIAGATSQEGKEIIKIEEKFGVIIIIDDNGNFEVRKDNNGNKYINNLSKKIENILQNDKFEPKIKGALEKFLKENSI